MTPLPIDARTEEIVSTARQSSSLLIEAPPGAGKTTRVPRALLEHGVTGGQILVLQPRRIATRLAARRVADEMGEPLGRTVGYQIRFEEVASIATRLRFLTEGVLERRLLSDPQLEDVGVVVLDEFHERSIASDVCLALLRRLQLGPRPDLKIIVMSATLEVEAVAAYLEPCPVLRTQGRPFEIEIEHLQVMDSRPAEQQVLAALKRVNSAKRPGHTLVFLPGAGEIRRTRQICEPFAQSHRWAIRPLHGELPSAEQDLAVEPSLQRKLILSTNVAETSVTIEGVGCVIDSGLARVASHSPWSGLPVLRVQKISKASAVQRAGRAGRTQAGYCLRLYTETDFKSRPDHETPEIRRADLAETLMALRAMGVDDLAEIAFFETPARASVDAAELLLRRLGAIVAAGRITGFGKQMARFPLHPRQSRLLVEAEARGLSGDGALIAALVGEREIRLEARSSLKNGGGSTRAIVSGPSDLLDAMERFREAESLGFAAARLRALGLEPAAVRRVDQVQRQLSRMLRTSRARPQLAETQVEDALLISTLAAYPDRVAKRRSPRSRELLLSEGGQALLSETSVVLEPELLVAVDAEERRTTAGAKAVVRIASKIEPEWLLELAPEEILDVDQLEWNSETKQVERARKLSYGQLALEEKRTVAPPSAEASRLLAQAASAAPIEQFVDPEILQDWEGRVDLLRRAFPEAGFPELNAQHLRSSLADLAPGATSFAELAHAGLLNGWEGGLTPQNNHLWRTMTPERITLPSGRQLKVHYAKGKSAWVESRMQDFFGMTKGPAILGGRVTLVMHLLAPNQRAVQVTDDLAGFWERHYPAIRRELSRKYPRHFWPEDPRHRPAPQAPRRKTD